MKTVNKIIATIAVVSMILSSAFSVSAASGLTATPSVDTVKGGETVTIDATFTDWVGMTPQLQLEFYYDKTNFTVDSTPNTSKNFDELEIDELYLPNYISSEIVENLDGKHILRLFGGYSGFSSNVNDGNIKIVTANTGSTTGLSEKQVGAMTTKNIGIVFKANSDIADGEYEFTVVAKYSNEGEAQSTETKVTKVKVGTTETNDFENVDGDQTVKDETTQEAKKYDGKYLKHISTVLTEAALSKRISIKCGDEERVSDRTIAETLGGIGVTGSSVTGTIAIGVLTSDINAVFTFDLVD